MGLESRIHSSSRPLGPRYRLRATFLSLQASLKKMRAAGDWPRGEYKLETNGFKLTHLLSLSLFACQAGNGLLRQLAARSRL